MNKKLKKVNLYPDWQLLSLLLSLLFTPLVMAQDIPITNVDSIQAIVDEDVILRSELDRAVAKIVARIYQQGGRLPPREALERQILERLILQKLQLAAAQKAGITASEDIVAQTINNIARENKLTMSQLRKTLEDDGISFRVFRKEIKEQLIIQRLRDQHLRRNIQVTDQELTTYIAQHNDQIDGRSDYHLLHILITVPEGASADELNAAKAKAERIVASLRADGDFRTIALVESDGQQALEGGDLGWRPSNQLPTLFASKVKLMERGEISDPMHSSSGYHIIMLEDYKGGERQIVTQTHLRHILIRTNEVTSDQDARSRLQQLARRIAGGEDFTQLARSHSDDKASALNGGDLGWLSPGDMLPRFREEVSNLSNNELSKPFRTDFGWHLVQVLARRDHDRTEDIVKAGAREAILKRKLDEESELFLRRLRDEAFIEIRGETL